MGWADILGQALVGGAMGFTGSRADSLEKEEARAEEEAMMNLKRSWQVEDKLWDQRMADVQWGREAKQRDKEMSHQRDMAKDQYSNQKGLLEMEHEYGLDRIDKEHKYDKPSDIRQIIDLFGVDGAKDLIEAQYLGKSKGKDNTVDMLEQKNKFFQNIAEQNRMRDEDDQLDPEAEWEKFAGQGGASSGGIDAYKSAVVGADTPGEARKIIESAPAEMRNELVGVAEEKFPDPKSQSEKINKENKSKTKQRYSTAEMTNEERFTPENYKKGLYSLKDAKRELHAFTYRDLLKDLGK